MKRSVLSSILSSLLILLFVYAASSKLFVIETFYRSLQGYPLIWPFATLVAYGVPALELLTAAMLMVPKWRQWGYRCSLVLLSCFTVYIVYLLLGAAKQPCSCGGLLSELSWVQHLFFNLLMVAFSVMGGYLERTLRYQKGIPPSEDQDHKFLFE